MNPMARLDRMARMVESRLGEEDYRRSMHLTDIEAIRGVIAALEAEIARHRAGGCARDQRTTQFCAEALDTHAENLRLRQALDRVECQLLDARDEVSRLKAKISLLGQ